MYKYDDPKDIQYQVRNLTSTVNLFVQPGFDELYVENFAMLKLIWNECVVSSFVL